MNFNERKRLANLGQYIVREASSDEEILAAVRKLKEEFKQESQQEESEELITKSQVFSTSCPLSLN